MSTPGWYPDPYGRFESRYWDGKVWTSNVATRGAQAIDTTAGAGNSAPTAATSPVAVSPHLGGCSDCGHYSVTGNGVCEACGHLQGLPRGIKLSSAAKRFGEICLEYGLVIVTLIIGWLIWSLIVWGRGQTPAKQILRMKVVKLETRGVASWGTMALREGVGKFLLVYLLIGTLTCGVGSTVLAFMLLWDRDRQELWDKLAGTVVIDDPDSRLQAPST